MRVANCLIPLNIYFSVLCLSLQEAPVWTGILVFLEFLASMWYSYLEVLSPGATCCHRDRTKSEAGIQTLDFICKEQWKETR